MKPHTACDAGFIFMRNLSHTHTHTHKASGVTTCESDVVLCRNGMFVCMQLRTQPFSHTFTDEHSFSTKLSFWYTRMCCQPIRQVKDDNRKPHCVQLEKAAGVEYGLRPCWWYSTWSLGASQYSRCSIVSLCGAAELMEWEAWYDTSWLEQTFLPDRPHQRNLI